MVLQLRSQQVKWMLERAPHDYSTLDDDMLAFDARQDPDSFAELYERYFEPVYAYCYVRLTDREAAEDATSEVFVKTIAGLASYHGGNFSAWLFRIAHNVVVNAYRQRRSHQSIDSADEPMDSGPTPEGSVMRDAAREELRAALALLSDEQRTVIELQLAGWSGAQIATVVGKTVSAVKMLRYRAVERLRTILTQRDQGLKEWNGGV